MGNFDIPYRRISLGKKKLHLAGTSEYSTLELLVRFERDFCLLKMCKFRFGRFVVLW